MEFVENCRKELAEELDKIQLLNEGGSKIHHDLNLIAVRNTALKLLHNGYEEEGTQIFTAYLNKKYPGHTEAYLTRFKLSSKSLSPFNIDVLTQLISQGYNLIKGDRNLHHPDVIVVPLKCTEDELYKILNNADGHHWAKSSEDLLISDFEIVGLIDNYEKSQQNHKYPF